jgi:hypothetical protein
MDNKDGESSTLKSSNDMSLAVNGKVKHKTLQWHRFSSKRTEKFRNKSCGATSGLPNERTWIKMVSKWPAISNSCAHMPKKSVGIMNISPH